MCDQFYCSGSFNVYEEEIRHVKVKWDTGPKKNILKKRRELTKRQATTGLGREAGKNQQHNNWVHFSDLRKKEKKKVQMHVAGYTVDTPNQEQNHSFIKKNMSKFRKPKIDQTNHAESFLLFGVREKGKGCNNNNNNNKTKINK